jgi:hypothetical protein
VVTDRDRSVLQWGGRHRGRSARRTSCRGASTDRRPPQASGACRPRPADAQSLRLWPAGAVGRDPRGAGVRGNVAGRPGAGERRDDHVPGNLRPAFSIERAERCELWGEPRPRAAERSVAGAELGRSPDGRPAVAPAGSGAVSPDPALPVAVEVELSIRMRRPEAICRAWPAPAGLGSSATTRRRTSGVRFPVPFRSPTPTTAFACFPHRGRQGGA